MIRDIANVRLGQVEQNARLALEISHRSYVFEIGKIALSGDSRSLSEDPRIRKDGQRARALL